jgi:hypothetical protein
MKLVVKALFGISALLLACSNSQLSANDPKVSDCEKAAYKVVRAFAEKMKKYDLDFIGDGAIMPHDRIEKLNVDFVYLGHCDIKKARTLDVIATKELIDLINGDDELRKYLIEFPFKRDRGRISISMRTQNGKWPLDGSVAFVSHASREDTICYDSAILEPVTYTNFLPDGNTIDPAAPTKIVMQSKLVDLYEEPFEEALRIVMASSSETVEVEYKRQ